jgi:hypothetical protein
VGAAGVRVADVGGEELDEAPGRFVTAASDSRPAAAMTVATRMGLHRMLAPHGDPSTENFFDIVSALQQKTRVKLHVTAKAA